MNRWAHILSSHPLKHGFRVYALKLKASMKTLPFTLTSLIKKTLHSESFSHVRPLKFGLLKCNKYGRLNQKSQCSQASPCSPSIYKLPCWKSFTKFKSIYNKFQSLLLFTVFPYQVIRNANIFAKVSLLLYNFAPGRSGRYMNLVKMQQEEPSFMTYGRS